MLMFNRIDSRIAGMVAIYHRGIVRGRYSPPRGTAIRKQFVPSTR